MRKSDIDLFVGSINDSLIQVMEKIDHNGYGILFLLDDEGFLVACVSDGDLRRWIIQGGNLDVEIKNIANYKPRFLYEDERKNANQYMKKEKVSTIPILNREKKIVDIYIYFDQQIAKEKSECHALSHTPVVIMAGGRGTRLFPYTKILPKPLIPVGNVPILERILQKFNSFGVQDVYLVVNYKKEMIKAYFSELGSLYKIRYIDEDKPLGTAGGIKLIETEFDAPVIITNCDTIIDADYGDILKHHIECGNDMTIVSSFKDIQIRYGVIHAIEGGQIESMEEKPHILCFINTGMYIVNPEHLDRIPKNELFNMTDLSELLISSGKKVGMYPIGENAFLDMGEFEEMKRMEEILAGKNFTENDGNIN